MQFLMFTRKPTRLLTVVALVAGGTLAGCHRSPDPAEYGEVIFEVPERLNQPFPLPELEESQEKAEEATK